MKELFENLNNESKVIKNDCIKVIYEIGKIKPKLIAGHTKEFVALLENKNNRLQWGAMTALHSITQEYPEEIYKALPQIIEAADKGSVFVLLGSSCIAMRASQEIPACVWKFAEKKNTIQNKQQIKHYNNEYARVICQRAKNLRKKPMRDNNKPNFNQNYSPKMVNLFQGKTQHETLYFTFDTFLRHFISKLYWTTESE